MFPFQLRFLAAREVLVALLDVAIVAYVLYRFFILIRGTRAVQLIKGIVFLLVATAVSRWLNLVTVNWLLERTLVMLVVALPIVFQPELRRALEQLGRGKFFARPLFVMGEEDMTRLVGEVVKATRVLARNKVGAIIVLERQTGLSDIVETGIPMDALASSELLVNIFTPATPLHDGAVILRGNRVLAAACFLPLAEAVDISRELGSRHRAALGITEHSDAVAIVVSEETGSVSLANAGKLMRFLDEKTLTEMLAALCRPAQTAPFHFWYRG